MAKVLVVDDDPASQSLFAVALGMAGHEVLSACDGQEGVEIARREMPDLIFMDLMMPVMDGETAAYHLKHDPLTAGISIVAVSARALGEEAKFYFDGCLRKPCALSGILNIARNFQAQGAPSTVEAEHNRSGR